MACVSTVAEIEAFCGGINAAGLDRELAITGIDELLAIPAASAHVISTNITYRASPAGKFYRWGFAKKDASYESERDPETGLWKTTVKIFIQKLESAKTNILNAQTGENLVAIVPDRNGNKRLIGSLTNGCMITVKEVTNPANGYEVQILWESAHSPYFYTGTITY